MQFVYENLYSVDGAPDRSFAGVTLQNKHQTKTINYDTDHFRRYRARHDNALLLAVQAHGEHEPFLALPGFKNSQNKNMIMDKKIVNFGEDVAGYNIPVLNEREIRAAAGIMFVLLFSSLMLILLKRDFLLVKYVIVVFLSDFMIRVFLNPRFSPLLITSRWIVSRQAPEYVGAPQKKFAWSIGLALSAFMFLLLVVMNSYSSFTLFTCLVCLLFLFFESAFGICLGCIVYRWMYKTEPLYCAGESCDQNKKEAVQEISGLQVLCLGGFMICLLLVIFLFGDRFSASPKNLRELVNPGYGMGVEMPGDVRLRSASHVQPNNNDVYAADAAFSLPLLLR